MHDRADVTLLAGGGGPLFDLAVDLGIPTVRLATMDNALSPVKAIMAMQELMRALRQISPDVIHTHSAKASALGRVAGWLLRIPVIYTVHGFAFKPEAPWKQRTIARIVEWCLAPLTSRVICVADAERALAAGLPIPSERIIVIPNGIADVAIRSTPTEHVNRIVTVMRLAAPKRPDVVISAFFAAQLPDCELVIAGDGPLRDTLEEQAGQLVPGRVRFVGSVSEIPNLLASAQVFLLASDHEGFPISVLEAMRAELPVVASDLPGIREQLAGGRCGILVQGNEPQAFAQALERLAEDTQQRAALANAARVRWEEQFGLTPMVSATWNVYEQVLAERKPQRMRTSVL
ncbi:glycosyl transferase [Cupriavidus sp. TKC]|uniref:glycosyltransferase family 4 protein n=2 Tax=unclassified Cupriavidus TaxID=2640874 RepID=UPI0002A1F3B0|nr:glycosyl transferase group 1 [Cupriavidus sp. HMR-1]GMG90975.1 glycosyl transferase [Cupriavidus sp. TKC]